MNNLSSGKPKLARKVLSMLALGAMILGGFSSLAFTSQVYADAVVSSVGATPNTGTRSAGSTVDVYLQAADATSALSLAGSCKVNGSDVSSTFQDLSGGLYKVVYTVGASDPERAAGDLPIDCIVQNAASVTQQIIAFTDGNSLAIDTNNDGTVTPPPFISRVEAVPNTGTVTVGHNLEVYMQAPPAMNDVTVDGSCSVNGVDVAGTLQNLTGGLYKVTYTVGGADSSRAAGAVPVDCHLKNGAGATVAVSAFTDSNTVAIDTTPVPPPDGGGGSGTTTSSSLTFQSVGAVPNTGTITTGHNLEVYLQAADHIALGVGTDVTLNGACTVNNKDVSSTFQNLTDGLYKVTYTVAQGDTARAAGTVPFSCALQNGAGATTTVTAFTDSNTVAIDASAPADNGGGGDNGTTTPPAPTGLVISSVAAVPNSGTITTGNHLEVYLAASSTETDVTTDGACKVNGIDVANSFQNLTGGLYRITYSVASSDSSRAAGMIPLDCHLKDGAGQTATVSAFTDSNTVAIDAGSATTTPPGNGGNGGNNTSTTTGDLNGNVNGGAQDAPLAVNSISTVSGTGTAGGGYEHGWSWVFHVTVPTDETSLSMKFNDWTHSNGTNHLWVGGFMRISSPQASSADPVGITATNTYTAPLTLTGDADPSTPGRQVDIKVEMQIQSDALNGSYTTNYGIKTN